MRKFSDRKSLNSDDLTSVNGGYKEINSGFVEKTCTQSWCGKTSRFSSNEAAVRCRYCNFPYDDNPIKRIFPIT